MTYDFSPFYRSTVGYDRVFDMLDRFANADNSAHWPPYNIERTSEDDYRITMAVAGFAQDELEIVQQQNGLMITGQKKTDAKESEMLHRGIAGRSFKQTFELADHVKVMNADLKDGLLTIDLKREVPEALKPRRIPVGMTAGNDKVQQITKAA